MRWVTEEQDELEETTKRTIQAVIIDMSSKLNKLCVDVINPPC